MRQFNGIIEKIQEVPKTNKTRFEMVVFDIVKDDRGKFEISSDLVDEFLHEFVPGDHIAFRFSMNVTESKNNNTIFNNNLVKWIDYENDAVHKV